MCTVAEKSRKTTKPRLLYMILRRIKAPKYLQSLNKQEQQDMSDSSEEGLNVVSILLYTNQAHSNVHLEI